jgi:hypothetical protein
LYEYESNHLHFIHNYQCFQVNFKGLHALNRKKPVSAFREKNWAVCFDVAGAAKNSIPRRSLAAQPMYHIPYTIYHIPYAICSLQPLICNNRLRIATKFLYNHFSLYMPPVGTCVAIRSLSGLMERYAPCQYRCIEEV